MKPLVNIMVCTWLSTVPESEVRLQVFSSCLITIWRWCYFPHLFWSRPSEILKYIIRLKTFITVIVLWCGYPNKAFQHALMLMQVTIPSSIVLMMSIRVVSLFRQWTMSSERWYFQNYLALKDMDALKCYLVLPTLFKYNSIHKRKKLHCISTLKTHNAFDFEEAFISLIGSIICYAPKE